MPRAPRSQSHHTKAHAAKASLRSDQAIRAGKRHSGRVWPPMRAQQAWRVLEAHSVRLQGAAAWPSAMGPKRPPGTRVWPAQRQRPPHWQGFARAWSGRPAVAAQRPRQWPHLTPTLAARRPQPAFLARAREGCPPVGHLYSGGNKRPRQWPLQRAKTILPRNGWVQSGLRCSRTRRHCGRRSRGARHAQG